jgi:hypothetical protein
VAKLARERALLDSVAFAGVETMMYESKIEVTVVLEDGVQYRCGRTHWHYMCCVLARMNDGNAT